jgi:hypothetical protein
MEDNIMDDNDYDLDKPLTDDKIDAQRDIIRQSLNEIANDVGMMLRDAGLTCPVFLTVPNSGNSLATVATPIDPPDEDWSRVIAIVSQIIEERLGTGKLRARELRCAMANAQMSAADVTID